MSLSSSPVPAKKTGSEVANLSIPQEVTFAGTVAILYTDDLPNLRKDQEKHKKTDQEKHKKTDQEKHKKTDQEKHKKTDKEEDKKIAGYQFGVMLDSGIFVPLAAGDKMVVKSFRGGNLASKTLSEIVAKGTTPSNGLGGMPILLPMNVNVEEALSWAKAGKGGQNNIIEVKRLVASTGSKK